MWRVAIVGRPNVGKSSLFNALRDRVAAQLTGPVARTTRDARAAPARLGPLRFQVCDTAGLEGEDESGAGYGSNWAGMAAAMLERTHETVAKSDVVLFVVDRELTGADYEVDEFLRKLDCPRIVVVNKCEGGREPDDFRLFCRDYPEPVHVSAKHGDGMPDLLEALRAVGAPSEAPEPDRAVRVALVGRPNVGKSSLLNAAAGRPVALTAPTPGVTRDPVHAAVEFRGRSLVMVDTAGIRGSARRAAQGTEADAVKATEREAKRDDVVVLVFDSTSHLTTDDRRLTRQYIHDAGALVVAATKADACSYSKKQIQDGIATELSTILRRSVPIVACSATWPTAPLLAAILRAHDAYANKHLTTSALNAWFRDWIASPLGKDAQLAKVRFIAQVATSPPTFTLHGRNLDKALSDKAVDTLKAAIARDFHFHGANLQVFLRNNTTPFLNAAKKKRPHAVRQKMRS